MKWVRIRFFPITYSSYFSLLWKFIADSLLHASTLRETWYKVPAEELCFLPLLSWSNLVTVRAGGLLPQPWALLSQELLIHCYWNTLLGLSHCPQAKQIKLQGPHPSLGCPQPPATPAQATSAQFTQGTGRCQNRSGKTPNSRRFRSIQNFPFPAVGLQVWSTS